LIVCVECEDIVAAHAAEAAQELIRISPSLIVDFDDTLVATFSIRSLTLSRTAAMLGASVDVERLRALWGRPFPELIAGIVPEVPFDDFIALYREEMRKDQPVGLPGAAALLRYCQAMSKRVVVHSASRTDLIEQDLASLGWSSLVAAIFGIDRTIYSKPDPRSLRAPLEWIEVRSGGKDALVYIGDSPGDSFLARSAGLPFIGVLSGPTRDQNAYAPDAMIVTSLEDLRVSM